jgi:hypothetical protein
VSFLFLNPPALRILNRFLKQGIYGIDMGCLSIEFYPEPGTDAPRCNLYSEGVAESLDMIIPQVPNVWYDLGCGLPTR